ncbi:lamin tail domain-containing protein [Phytoactinopolyspora mesophila]|uniref:LTD domain-containing protein n=1 Tax=Phytoactinopolyspora mesophila TaxID=2650750 RepID=A0A7K3LXW5_9ACTN|nr:lamin tail domain-containing protein [Phytoactinopolyspora mesophila]NDL55853.1 hypothetical protein [Phytoactinopolyspora mesophila]
MGHFSVSDRRLLTGTATVVVAAAIVTSSLLVASGSPSDASAGPDVRISELTNTGPAGSSDNFIEIANFGDEPADLDGWSIYRCAATGSRVYDAQVPKLDGVELAPGETFVIAHENSTVEHADVRYDVSLANAGFGAWIEDAERNLIDSVAVYAAPTDSECALDSTPLPNVLDAGRAQSYQRVDVTGDPAADFIRAERTPGSPNASVPDPGVQASDVLISELTNGGPGGSSDNFVEFANFGDEPVDISAWRLYRCAADGRRFPGTLQAEIPAGTVLASGEVFVAAHDVVDVPDDVPHVRYDASLANAGFGALLADAEGNVMDSVGVYEADGVHQPAVGSPCIHGAALPNRLDYGFDQTYQRFRNTGDNSADFVKATRSLGELVTPDPGQDADPEPVDTGVRISELVHSGPAGRSDNFFELANFGDEPVSLEGWTVHRCQADGRRNPSPQIPVIDDVTLDPGDTYLAVRSGSPLHDAGIYDAVYSTSFSDDGFGVIVYDADGRVADSAGVYDAIYSPCTQELSAMNILDFAGGDSIQRLQQTGNNSQDFVVAPRTPGELPADLRHPGDFTDDELAPVHVDPAPRPFPAQLGDAAADPESGSAELSAVAAHTSDDNVEVTFTGARRVPVNERAARIYSGVTDHAPPASRRIDGEELLRSAQVPDVGRDTVVSEAVDGFPFQRYELTTSADMGEDVEIAWSGRSTGTNELQMYAWNHRSHVWDLLAADGGVVGGEITLVGAADRADHVRGRRVDVLVMDGPAVREAFSDDDAEPNLAFKDPDEYDFAFGYMTDTQFLSEGYRSPFAEMNRWIVTNQDARNIAYTFHTGDIIQRWMNGTHSEARARNEYEFASRVMNIFERTGHPYGVTPGNHDDKWGREKEMFNEYFPASRFEDQPWFGGAWRDNDAQNHYDVMEIAGAKFLMVYLGYFAGDDAIDWAADVIAEYPDHNVIFATHEYIHADGTLSSPDTYRWTSLGQRYWDELILPNENVFMVLAGHFHGVALNIKRNVDGVDGRVVVEMMANYQNFERDGLRNAGFLRLLQVDLDAKRMAVNTYAPLHDEHNAWEYDPLDRYGDADDEFTIEVDLNDSYDKRVETDLIAVQEESVELGTVTAVAGEPATVSWTGLESDVPYTWYARSEDAGGRTAVSPVAAFTMQAPS